MKDIRYLERNVQIEYQPRKLNYVTSSGIALTSAIVGQTFPCPGWGDDLPCEQDPPTFVLTSPTQKRCPACGRAAKLRQQKRWNGEQRGKRRIPANRDRDNPNCAAPESGA